MRTSERRKRNTSFRKDSYTVVLLFTLMAVMVFRIPLGYIIGDKGLAYFGTANEIFILMSGVIGCWLSEAVAILVRYRIKRDQIRSAQKVISTALLLGMVLGTLLSVLVGALAHVLAESVFKIPLAGMAVRIISPAIVLQILTAILRGYFQGNGSKIPAIHSRVLNTIFLFVGGLAGAIMMHGYGEKVSALLQNEDYACAYGALGAALGVLAAEILSFFHIFILYFLLKGKMRKQMGRELQRNQDTGFHICGMLLGTGAMYGVCYLIFGCRVLIDEYLIYSIGRITEQTDMIWGSYYGKHLVVIGVIICVVLLYCLLPVKRIIVLVEHNEYRSAKERLGVLIHQSMVLAVPAAVFLAVFAENLLNALFKGNNSVTAEWIQLGSVSLLFAVFAVVFMDILLKLKKIKAVIILAAISLLIHIVVSVVLLTGTKLGITAVIAGIIIFWVFMAGSSFVMIGRMMQYKQEWIRCVAFPVAAAAASGLLGMLLNKALISLIGNTASLIVCLILAVIIYMVLLIALKDFTEEELEIMTGGKLILAFARMLRLM